MSKLKFEAEMIKTLNDRTNLCGIKYYNVIQSE